MAQKTDRPFQPHSPGLPILQSKLSIPRIPPTIERERLNTLLVRIQESRITTVTAGAGYGKTTLIVQAVGSLGWDLVWYGLDPSDGFFSPFMNYLLAGFRKAFSGFGPETGKMLQGEWGFPLKQDEVLRTFLSEIEKTIKSELLIVLDDFHLIQDQPDIRSILTLILDHLPSNIHLILISRAAISLELSRFRARRQVLDILEEDLIFTPQEIQQLFSQVFQTVLEPKIPEILYDKTGGWVSALILFHHSIQGKPSLNPKEFLSRLPGSQKLIFTFLEESVYEALPGKTQDFLIRTSLFDYLNSDFCNRLLSIDQAGMILRDLEDRHQFTYSLDETRHTFYYHTLFREFLKTKLIQEMDTASIRTFQRRAAQILETEGRLEEALEHYLAGEDLKAASAILSRIGRQLVMEGRFQRIHDRLLSLPDRTLNQEPWILYIKAQILQVWGRSREAVKMVQKAGAVFRKQQILEGEIICLIDLGRNAFIKGDFKEAELNYRNLLTNASLNHDLAIELCGYLIIIYAYWGNQEDSERFFSKGLELLPADPSSRLSGEGWLSLARGFRFLFSGDFHQALRDGKQVKSAIEPLGLYRLLAMSFQVISTAQAFLGQYADGLEQAEAGIRTVTRQGLKDNNPAWLMICASLNSTGIGDTEKALGYGREALEYFQEQASPWGMAYACRALFAAYRKKGDPERAEGMAIKGLETIDGLALPLIKGELTGFLAACKMEKGHFKEALPFLKAAKRMLPIPSMVEGWLSSQFSRYFWGIGERSKALDILTSSLKTYKEDPNLNGLVSEKHWILPLLVHLFARGEGQGPIGRFFRTMGPYGLTFLDGLQKNDDSRIIQAARMLSREIPQSPPPGLIVHLLGPFRLMVGETLVPEKQWKSQKAKTLFKYLAYHRFQGYLNKEILMELVWPEEDPRKSAKRFHVALASIRKTLEPDLPRGVPSSYIKSIGDTYHLELGDKGFVDSEQFLTELRNSEGAENPEAALSHWLKAVALYQGDLLPEDPYVEWCQTERERLREKVLTTLSKLIAFFEGIGNWQKCIEYAEKSLNTDPYGEDIYRQLMGCYSQSGNRGGIAKTFQRCKQKIMVDLDSPLSPETEALYRALMRG